VVGSSLVQQGARVCLPDTSPRVTLYEVRWEIVSYLISNSTIIVTQDEVELAHSRVKGKMSFGLSMGDFEVAI
jgi:hypothetical protein